MGSNIIWYFAGLLTIPILGGLWILLVWAFGKESGSGSCVTECRGSAWDMEIGDHFNLTVWLYGVQHRLFWSSRPSHKAAVTKYWQDIYDAGGQTRTDVGVNFHRD
jgi:hypothetical protein